MMNIRPSRESEAFTAKQGIAFIVLISLLFGMFDLLTGGQAEAFDDPIPEEWVILEDPELFYHEETTDASEDTDTIPPFPVITSIGKTNIKMNGVISSGTLIRYTVPEALLRADADFLALMTEAEKYIGYPYVYGGSKPGTGFDCSGFVCWVFRKSGVCNISRMGANGLYKKCTEVTRKDLRPGDLVFFEGTMGPGVKGITHVGIFVGNNMMIHAGDPVGFADLEAESWKSKIVCYGRLKKK